MELSYINDQSAVHIAMETTYTNKSFVSNTVYSETGRIPKKNLPRLSELARQQTRERNLEKTFKYQINTLKEEKVRRNCFRTFLNRQEALDQKYYELEAQMGLLSFIAPNLTSRIDTSISNLDTLTTQTTDFIADTRKAAQNIQESARSSTEELKTSIGSFFTDLPSKIQNLI